jgi:ankyrin repeat protein
VTLHDPHKRSALALACRQGDADIVRLLLDKGCCLSAVGEWRSTPLHVAAQRGHHEIVELLLERGADVSLADQEGGPPSI